MMSTFSEFIVQDTALEWFGELGYAIFALATSIAACAM